MGGWGYSPAKAGEVTQLTDGICSTMCRHVQRWYPYLAPIGVGGLYGGSFRGYGSKGPLVFLRFAFGNKLTFTNGKFSIFVHDLR